MLPAHVPYAGGTVGRCHGGAAGIKEKWKVFEVLWRRRNMYRDYYDAMNQDQTYMFLDKLKELFG
jgi:hypothetical protein